MLEVGKLDSELLKKIVFDRITYKRDEVKVRAAVGEDCAVINYGEYDCVVSTDPITAAIEEIGNLSIHISCNDIASNGVEPIAIMLTVLLPIGTTVEDVDKIMEQAGKAAAKLQVEIVGGHTEITGAVNKPVIVSTAFGKKTSSQIEKKMSEGDVIIMTKSAGVEGVGIIASDFGDRLEGIVTKEEIKMAKGFLEEVSVVREGVAAGKIGVRQMHDVTEGGILGAVWEMCQVGEMGAEIKKESILIENVTQKICDHFDVNPYRLISSGCMLIIAEKEKEKEILDKMKEIGVGANIIGEIKEKPYGILMNGEVIEPPKGDEIYKVV